MNDNDALVLIVDYLDLYEADLYEAYYNGSDVVRPFIQAKISAVSEIIDYIEQATGIKVRLIY